MVRYLIFLLMLVCFLGGCTRETNHFHLSETTDSVKIDESKIVMTRFPGGLKEINDSIIGLINNNQYISLYNIVTGENVLNFSTASINFDSLVKNTFQKRFLGKRLYNYTPESAGGLSGGNSQVAGFDYYNHSFYIYVNILVDVNYDNDPEKLKKLYEEPSLKALKEKSGDFDLIVGEYLEFIFITDEQFNLTRIVPLFERNKLLTDDYCPYYLKNYAANNTALFVPIQKNQTPVNLHSKVLTGSGIYTLAKIDLNVDEGVEYALESKNIDFDGYTLGQYYSSCLMFKSSFGKLYFSNGKEICEIENEKKLFSKTYLARNEWISDFYSQEGYLLLTTYKTYKKTNPTEMDNAYEIDSTGNISAKIFDLKSQAWKEIKEFKYNSSKSFYITNDKIIYIEKGKENYVIKTIQYAES